MDAITIRNYIENHIVLEIVLRHLHCSNDLILSMNLFLLQYIIAQNYNAV